MSVVRLIQRRSAILQYEIITGAVRPTEPVSRAGIISEATSWVRESLNDLKNADGDNPYRDMGDEEIAALVLKDLEENP